MRVLISWIGRSDLIAAAKDRPADDPGPVLRLLRRERFDIVHLLNDISPAGATGPMASPKAYASWLARQIGLSEDAVQRHDAEENMQNQYGLAFAFTQQQLKGIYRAAPDAQYALLLSPGYPAAQLTLVIAAQTLFDRPPTLYNTFAPKPGHEGSDVEIVQLPFTLSVDAVLNRILQGPREPLEQVPLGEAFEGIWGESDAIVRVKRLVQQVASYTDVSVLLLGETGTGKERFARALHQASPRHNKPFCPINCAAIPSELLESELFGHVKGAFTSAVANRKGTVARAEGGTVFLDEIGEMPLHLQPKLLRFLQERQYEPVGGSQVEHADVRVVAATNVDLEAAITQGTFREDLFHRINTVTVHLPPLRNRGRDVIDAARRLLERFNRQYGKSRAFTDEALRMLARRPWWGNFRELENAVTRLAIFAATDRIEAADIEFVLGRSRDVSERPLAELNPAQFLTHLAAVTDEMVERFKQRGGLPIQLGGAPNIFEDLLDPLLRGRALRLTGGNPTQAFQGLRTSKLDLSTGKADARHVDAYQAYMAPWIDEANVQRLRGERPP